MKKYLSLSMVVIMVCFTVVDAGATLIQGQFAGTIDINGTLSELGDGAFFSGQFVYDTSAISAYTGSSGTQHYAYANGVLRSLFFELIGANGLYSYTYSDTNNYPSGADIRHTDAGNYSLYFDFLPTGKSNFIGDLDLLAPELLLEFKNTFVADPNHPVITPQQNDLVKGNSYSGSVLYLWVMDLDGVNPGNAQINCNISTLSLTSSVQPVPEPATIVLLAGGLAGLAGYRRRRSGAVKF